MARKRGQRKGYLFPRGPSWMGQWREDVRLADGSLHRAKVARVIAPRKGPGAVSKREAHRIFHEQVLARLDTVSLQPQSMMTVADFVKVRFQWDVVQNTRSNHYATTLKHVLPALGHLRLRDVRPIDVQNLLTRLRDAGYSWQWRKHIRSTITAIFKHAKRLEYLVGDIPTQFIDLGEPIRQERGALSPEQVWALAERLEQPYRALLLLLACVGLRISEALGLRWKRLNLTPGAVQIDGVIVPEFSVALREAWVRQAWTPLLKNTGSKGILPIPELIVGELAALKVRSRWSEPEDPVFAVTGGQPFEPCNACRKKLKPLVKELGLPKQASWHWLRHTLASIADQAGMSLTERQAVLRHADASMTARYTHAEFERLRLGLNAVAERIVPKPQGGVM